MVEDVVDGFLECVDEQEIRNIDKVVVINKDFIIFGYNIIIVFGF